MAIKKLMPIMNTAYVADLFGVTERTIQIWENKGIIHGMDLDTCTTRFSQTEIERVMATQRDKRQRPQKKEAV